MKLPLIVMTTVTFLNFIEGDVYCSKNKTNIDCRPCSDICDNEYETCRYNNLYTCPLNCSVNTKCNYVCCDFCREDKCIYTFDGQVKCSEGCMPGTTGVCCHELCPTGCKECNQFNDSCTSCVEGWTGYYCNESVQQSEMFGVATQTLCPPQGVSCDEQNTICCPSVSMDTPKQEGSKDKISLVAGLSSTVFLILSIFICYRLAKTYLCVCKKRTAIAELNHNSDQSLSSEHRYNYIDENDLDSYYSPLRRNQDNVHYGNIGNKCSSEDDIKRSSCESSSSGTLFGNLFETSDNQSENINNGYITPSLP